MLIGYVKLFMFSFALLPTAVEATAKCQPSRRTKAVTQKTQNGNVICATSPPTETLTADAKVLCLHACLRSTSCEDGFNYRSDSKLCQLYFDQPTSFRVEPNCDYLKVQSSYVFYLFLFYLFILTYFILIMFYVRFKFN